MPTEFQLPELGENITSGDVLRVMVSPGDTITKDQPVVELETDKATIEVPSSVEGVVKEIRVKAGDKVKVGQAILVVDEATGAGKDEGQATASQKAKDEKTPAPAVDKGATTSAGRGRQPEEPAADEDRGPTAQKAAQTKEAEKSEAAEETARAAKPEPAEAPRSRRGEVVDIRGPRASLDAAPSEAPAALAPASPSVRRLARELGVDINAVSGSSPSDRISQEDVKAFAKRAMAAQSGGAGVRASVPLPDFSRWGEIERKPMRAVRRKTAEHLARAWATIPHVTQHDRADITALDQARQKYASRVEQAGGALTITAILVKVLASAVKVFPQFNSSLDSEAEEIVYKKYVHVGVAVDTDRGLLVPVIRDADRKNALQISVELTQLAEKARGAKLTLPEMEGGSITITNLGGIGGTSFSPIVNAPEVAILGVSRASFQPVYDGPSSGTGGHFEPRLLLPLSLSYDHRVIDGADAIRFLRWIVEALEQPLLLALQG
jgi:pyruvate dehydrogenase E2 component (dihydrolipoamide acetyltransferase)